MLILQPKRKHKYLSCETFIWKKNGKIIHGRPSFGKKIQISSRDCLLLGKNTNIFRERPSFWEKTQISFSYSYFFWKTTNSMRVTATFWVKTTNIFQLRLLFLEKQRIPCVQRLLFQKSDEFHACDGCFFRKATNSMRATATNRFIRKKKGAESQHYAFFPLPPSRVVFIW